ncbi:helix-turn-helix transcriptional regulator [Clostridium saudiense]|jgi:transcriptional regulator with XRE-family HTH domain|uniref:helix-turn-helix domain-containing protein n=1 Tax=Clostridium TaxID=1485 RepID=UPI00205DF97C|nr:helix-turn-helix transcriptional regulator [Clostridium saudiense]DAE72656.1 MAG TPA: hypothetical protein [Caudoviricetes sp.]DAU87220.1 MAG TPA: helix-turn-helix domain protein [Caudoviricetes sp.]
MGTFGDRLKELRLEKDLTQPAFGKIFNVEKGTVSNWENENRFPDKNTLKALADYFDVSLDYLLGRSDIRKPLNIDPLFQGAGGEKFSEAVETIAAHLESKDKEITPKKMKLLKSYIDTLFDDFDDE